MIDNEEDIKLGDTYYIKEQFDISYPCYEIITIDKIDRCNILKGHPNICDNGKYTIFHGILDNEGLKNIEFGYSLSFIFKEDGSIVLFLDDKELDIELYYHCDRNFKIYTKIDLLN